MRKIILIFPIHLTFNFYEILGFLKIMSISVSSIMCMIFAAAGLELALIWATLLNDSCTHVFCWSFAACGERKLEERVPRASLLRWTTLCEGMAMDDVLLENDAGLR